MNDIFSFKRTGRLIKAFFREYYKNFAILFLAVIALIVVFTILSNNWNPNSFERWNDIDVFMICAFTLPILGGRLLLQFEKKESAMFQLSLPTSPLERLSAVFLFSMIVFPLLYLAVFYIVDETSLRIFNTIHQSDYRALSLGYLSFHDYFGFFTINSVVIFGTLFFKKHGAPKTIMLLVALLLLQIFIVDLFLPENCYSMIEFSELQIREYGTGNRITINGFIYYFKFLLLPLCWILSYMKLKEKEV